MKDGDFLINRMAPITTWPVSIKVNGNLLAIHLPVDHFKTHSVILVK